MEAIKMYRWIRKSCAVNWMLLLVATVLVQSIIYAQDEAVPYPTYNEVPSGLPFSCTDKITGYYADPDTRCQVFHWCVPSGQKFSFLCPNGTVFNQAVRVCDWFYNVNCQDAASYYSVNSDLYKDSEGNPIKG